MGKIGLNTWFQNSNSMFTYFFLVFFLKFLFFFSKLFYWHYWSTIVAPPPLPPLLSPPLFPALPWCCVNMIMDFKSSLLIILCNMHMFSYPSIICSGVIFCVGNLSENIGIRKHIKCCLTKSSSIPNFIKIIL